MVKNKKKNEKYVGLGTSFKNCFVLYNHRLFRQGLETGHVSHTFYDRRLCAVNIIMDSTF